MIIREIEENKCYHLGDLGVNRRKILKHIYKNKFRGVTVWIGFS
jgi:hypothetical protein